MEPFERLLERHFYRELKPSFKLEPVPNEGPETQALPLLKLVTKGSEESSGHSLWLFVSTYTAAAIFCALVLIYQFSLIPAHRMEREKLHQVNNQALTLKAHLFELFFKQQDFMNQELVAKLPPKAGDVKEMMDKVEQSAQIVFANEEADAGVKQSFDTSFKNFKDLWSSTSARAMGGDPEGAKFEFLATDSGLRDSILESIDSQTEALRTGFQVADQRLHSKQTQFAYLIFAAGLGFLLLFLREMSAYFSFRRMPQQSELPAPLTLVTTPVFVPTAAPAINLDFQDFKGQLEALQLSLAQLGNKFQDEAKRKEQILLTMQGILSKETATLSEWRADKEIAGVIESLSQAMAKIEKLSASEDEELPKAS